MKEFFRSKAGFAGPLKIIVRKGAGQAAKGVVSKSQQNINVRTEATPQKNTGGWERLVEQQARTGARNASAAETEAKASQQQARIAQEEHNSQERDRIREDVSGLGTLWCFIALALAILTAASGGTINSGWVLSYDALFSLDIMHAILVSSIFGGLLASYVLREFFDHHASLGLVFVYFGLSAIAAYGISGLTDISALWGYLFTPVFIVIFMYATVKGEGRVSWFDKTDVAYILYAVIMTILIPNVLSWVGVVASTSVESFDAQDFTSSPAMGIMHFLFITGFGWTYIRAAVGKEGKATFYLLTSALLFVDFMVSSYLIQYKLAGYFSLVAILSTIYVSVTSNSKLAKWMVFAIVFISFYFLPNPALGQTLQGTIVAEQASNPGSFVDDFLDRFKTYTTDRFDAATAISGTVEQNQFENLGVYFADLQAADPRFFEGEDVTVWGSIRSKTYQDPVAVQFQCLIKKGSGSPIEPEHAIPEKSKKILISDFEETDVECRFNGNELSVGTEQVIFQANYNFVTDATKKTYFMDRDRYRSFVREDIDVFEQFGITDKNPQTIFTNGPVSIGIDAGPLITVQDDYSVLPQLIITVSNRENTQDRDRRVIQRWEGTVKSIRELVIFLPKGVDVAKVEEGENAGSLLCDPSFQIYTPQMCQSACDDQYNICKNAGGTERECSLLAGRRTGDQQGQCQDECDFLLGRNAEGDFGAIEGQFEAISVNGGTLQNDQRLRNFDNTKRFSCRLEPGQDALDGGPITTKNIRVRARYNYELENKLPVTIQRPPEDVLADVNLPGCTARGEKDAFMGILLQENRVRHCCQAASTTTCFTGGSPSSVDNREAQQACPAHGVQLTILPEEAIRRGDEQGIGLMQIFSSLHNGRTSKCVPGDQSLYNLNCNLRVGLDILQEGLRTYRNGNTVDCTDQVTDQKFESYRGYDAAIRSYVGWGCDEKHKDYVEDVRSHICRVQQDPNIFANVAPEIQTFVNTLSNEN